MNKFFHSLFFLLLFLLVPLFLHGQGTYAATCQPRQYTECEQGNPTACLGTGSGSTHNVPKGDRAQVTLHSDCSYTCVNLGKCTTPTPTPTPSITSQTTADVRFHVEGIDQANAPSTSPGPGKHTTWPFTIAVYNGSTLVHSYSDTATEVVDAASPLYGTFHNASFGLGSLASGSYTLFVTTPFGSLPAQIGTTAVSITNGKNNVLVPNSANTPLTSVPLLLMGDINQDGKIDITDYGILRQCYGDNATSTTCTTVRDQLISKFPSLPQDFIPGDLNDNGIVDGIDYNILLRGFLNSENTSLIPNPTCYPTRPTCAPGQLCPNYVICSPI